VVGSLVVVEAGVVNVALGRETRRCIVESTNPKGRDLARASRRVCMCRDMGLHNIPVADDMSSTRVSTVEVIVDSFQDSQVV
jgi:hypothetical protein